MAVTDDELTPEHRTQLKIIAKLSGPYSLG